MLSFEEICEFSERLQTLWPDWVKYETPHRAIEFLQSELQRFPQSVTLRERIGDALRMEDPESAEAAYLDVVERDPYYADGYVWLGYLYFTFTDGDPRAEECFRNANAIRRSSPAYVGLARVLLERGDRDGAAEMLAAAQECVQRLQDDIADVQRELDNPVPE